MINKLSINLKIELFDFNL